MRRTPYFSTNLPALRNGLVCRLSTPLARRYLVFHPNRFNVLMLWALLPEHHAWCEWILRLYIQFIWGLSTALGDKGASEFVLYCFSSQYIHATGVQDLPRGRQSFYESFQVMES